MYLALVRPFLLDQLGLRLHNKQSLALTLASRRGLSGLGALPDHKLLRTVTKEADVQALA